MPEGVNRFNRQEQEPHPSRDAPSPNEKMGEAPASKPVRGVLHANGTFLPDIADLEEERYPVWSPQLKGVSMQTARVSGRAMVPKSEVWSWHRSSQSADRSRHVRAQRSAIANVERGTPE